MPRAKPRKRARAESRSLRHDTAVAMSSLASLADVAADSLEAVLEKIDGEVFRELNLIAGHIETLRKEISALQPGKMYRESIPDAGRELDAIVDATESASNTILECAEQVMAANASDASRYKAFVQQRMLTIFEACSFQDLTGQRIAKVVQTLKQIEARVARFAKVSRLESRRTRQRPRGVSNSQAAVDRIFGGRR